MSDFYNGRTVYYINKDLSIVEYVVIEHDPQKHELRLMHKKLGAISRGTDYIIGRNLFLYEEDAIEEVKLKQETQALKAKEVHWDPPFGETVILNRVSVYPDAKVLPEERVSAGWSDERGHNIHKEDDWSKWDSKIKDK